MTNLRKLETEFWESADLLRAESKLTSQEYCMPVLGLIFLRYAYSRFRYVEGEILKNRPVRNGRVMPVEAIDFQQKSALFLPEEARYEYLLNLPDDANVGEKVNHAMALVEQQSQQLQGVLPKTYTSFKNDLLRELLRIFNNSALNDIQDDIIGRIYEYFLNKFAPAVASDDGVFFTPKSLVRMIVNIIEPKRGTVLEKTLSTLIQTNDTYESTQIDAFFESKPKIDAFLKIDANAQKVGIQNGILTPDVLETGCRFYVCGIFLVCFLYCVLRTSEKRAVSSFPLSCMPRLIHSSIHP